MYSIVVTCWRLLYAAAVKAVFQSNHSCFGTQLYRLYFFLLLASVCITEVLFLSVSSSHSFRYEILFEKKILLK